MELIGLFVQVGGGISLSEIKLIKEREKKVLQDFNNGITITCALWAPMANYFDEATKRIQCFFETKNIKDVKYSEDTYSKMIKAIYSIDDIEDWKIEKKLEYMKNCSPKKIRFLNIKLPYPRFRFKQCNYNTVLIQGEILKKTIRDCFKNRISDYFYDILFLQLDILFFLSCSQYIWFLICQIF